MGDTFSSFGVLLFAKIMRDPDTGASRGFGFISFDTFDASDAALASMNGQFICNRPISVSYAYKKETKGQWPWGWWCSTAKWWYSRYACWYASTERTLRKR